MDILREKLQNLDRPTASDIWTTLKESEESIIDELASLKEAKNEAYEKANEQIKWLENEKSELLQIKDDVLKINEKYKTQVKAVEKTFSEIGGDSFLDQISVVYSDLVEKSNNQLKEEIGKIIEESISSTDLDVLNQSVTTIKQIFGDNKELMMDAQSKDQVEQFYGNVVRISRLELWSHLQKYSIPIKPLEPEKIDVTDYIELCSKLHKICHLLWSLDYVRYGNNKESLRRIITILFEQLFNLSLDIIKNCNKETEFGQVLACSYKWSRNLKNVLNIIVDGLKVEQHQNVERIFDEEFMNCIEEITNHFLEKFLENPVFFTNYGSILKNFEEKFEIKTCGRDLLRPLYQPKYLKRLLRLEIEMFLRESNQIIENKSSLDQIDYSSILSNEKWSSEITIFFEEWITRINQDVLMINDEEAQTAYYDTALLLIHKLHDNIHKASKVWYLESSWVQTVYSIMNSIWEIIQIVQKETIAWAVDTYAVVSLFTNEWNRFARMLVSYVIELIDDIDSHMTYSKYPEAVRIGKIQQTFEAIFVFFSKVSRKASKSSRSRLLNELVFALVSNVCKNMEKWKYVELSLLSTIYSQMYSHFFNCLEYMERSKLWEKEEKTRIEIIKLDTILKMAANQDPSGELVRISFKSIDEEQVVKLLAQLGFHSTSDHAFQDYQVLAENWDKLQEKLVVN